MHFLAALSLLPLKSVDCYFSVHMVFHFHSSHYKFEMAPSRPRKCKATRSGSFSNVIGKSKALPVADLPTLRDVLAYCMLLKVSRGKTIMLCNA